MGSRARAAAVAAVILLAAPVSGQAQAKLPTAVRGAHTVYIWPPSSGTLSVTVTKRDLNIYAGKDELQVTLLDPTRRQVAKAVLPDDGNTGKGPAGTKVLSAALKVNAVVPGAYKLRVGACASSDCVFGLQTNGPGLVVEGGVMLNDASMAGKVYFAPPAGAFTARAMALHKPGCQKVPLRDAKAKAVATFTLCDATGKGVATWKSASIKAGAGDRTGQWYFDVAKLDVRLEPGSVIHWTMSPGAVFDALAMRWMLLPYTETRYLQPGQSAALSYTLRNSMGIKAPFSVKAVCPAGLTCKVLSPTATTTLSKGARLPVAVQVTVGATAKVGQVLLGALTAKNPMVMRLAQTSGARVVVGPSPVSKPIKLPVVHKPYQHENFLFGYAPDYVANEVYFDTKNRPVMRDRNENLYFTSALVFLENKAWVKRDFLTTVKTAYPGFKRFVYGGGFSGAKVAMDGAGGVYSPLRLQHNSGHQSLVLHTADRGKTYSVTPMSATSSDIQVNAHGLPAAPPPVLAYLYTAPHSAKWCSYYDLALYLPSLAGGKLKLGPPVLISKKCLGACQHSGGPGSLVTRKGRTHVVWGEISATGKDPGVPTYVATYDHKTKKLGKKVLLGFAPPVDDVHNVPAVVMDSKGYLHAVTGAHGANFLYLRSLKPDDASAWTNPVKTLTAGWVDSTTDKDGRGRQTYISLVRDHKDNLHMAFRQWRRNVDSHFPADQYYAALSIQTRAPGKPWGPARPVVVPPVPGYSIFYHKLTVDRAGRLYLSYNHWTSDTTYQGDFPDRYHHRAVLFSKDQGVTWKLAQTADFVAGVFTASAPDAGPPDSGAQDAAAKDVTGTADVTIADVTVTADVTATDRPGADRSREATVADRGAVDHAVADAGQDVEPGDSCSCDLGGGGGLGGWLLLLLLALRRRRWWR